MRLKCNVHKISVTQRKKSTTALIMIIYFTIEILKFQTLCTQKCCVEWKTRQSLQIYQTLQLIQKELLHVSRHCINKMKTAIFKSLAHSKWFSNRSLEKTQDKFYSRQNLVFYLWMKSKRRKGIWKTQNWVSIKTNKDKMVGQIKR